LFVIGGCWAGLLGVIPADAEELLIRVAGSTTLQPIVAQAAKQFQELQPEVRVVVGAGGSGHGIKAVAQGEVHIGMASRALKASEVRQWPELKSVPLGLDGIAIIVHASNPVATITSQQVRSLFMERITNWRRLGGPDAAVRLVSTNEQHGTFDAFVEHFGLEARSSAGENTSRRLYFRDKDGTESSGEGALSVDGNGPAMAAVMTKPYAVTYASMGAALRVLSRGQAPIKMLVLDGVEPSEANLINGRYPVQRPLQIVTRGEPSAAVARFAAYLAGPQGQAIMRRFDYLPVSGK
jgi:phosphate transport system substrate-binding protein